MLGATNAMLHVWWAANRDLEPYSCIRLVRRVQSNLDMSYTISGWLLGDRTADQQPKVVRYVDGFLGNGPCAYVEV